MNVSTEEPCPKSLLGVSAPRARRLGQHSPTPHAHVHCKETGGFRAVTEGSQRARARERPKQSIGFGVQPRFLGLNPSSALAGRGQGLDLSEPVSFSERGGVDVPLTLRWG